MPVIIDIGAHDGSCLAVPSAQQNQDNLVYAIEPIPELANSIRRHHLPNLFVFNLAIGEVEGMTEFNVNQDDQTSSLLPADPQGKWISYADRLKTVKSIQVQVKRLDSFITENNITDIDLLKIDAQGFDLQVLKSAGELIHSVRRIKVEVQLSPLYCGSADKPTVVEYLESRGFSLVYSQAQTDGLEENLEFTRVNRYSKVQSEAKVFSVAVPHVGEISMPHQDLVGRLLEKFIFEGSEQAFFWLYLRPGDTFFDCGSHAGLFSCIAAKRMENEGRIVGFDPNPECIELYQSNLQRLGCENFLAINVGLSNIESDSAQLRLGKEGMSAFSSFVEDAQSSTELGENVITVRQTTLDKTISELEIDRVELAKLDVEGWEANVLRGASQAIGEQKFPVWMIEFTEKNAQAAGTSTCELADLIESYGYTLCQFDATTLSLTPEKRKSQYPYTNLFAVLDIDSVNRRLQSSTEDMKWIARSIVHKWDVSVKADAYDNMLPHFEIQEVNCRLRLENMDKLSGLLAESEARVVESEARAARLKAANNLLMKRAENTSLKPFLRALKSSSLGQFAKKIYKGLRGL